MSRSSQRIATTLLVLALASGPAGAQGSSPSTSAPTGGPGSATPGGPAKQGGAPGGAVPDHWSHGGLVPPGHGNVPATAASTPGSSPVGATGAAPTPVPGGAPSQSISTPPAPVPGPMQDPAVPSAVSPNRYGPALSVVLVAVMVAAFLIYRAVQTSKGQ